MYNRCNTGFNSWVGWFIPFPESVSLPMVSFKELKDRPLSAIFNWLNLDLAFRSSDRGLFCFSTDHTQSIVVCCV